MLKIFNDFEFSEIYDTIDENKINVSIDSIVDKILMRVRIAVDTFK